MPLPLSPPDQELQRIMGAEMERRRMDHYRSMASPEQAAMLAGYGEQMPWMSGKTAMALTSEGVPANAPLAQEAGKREARKKSSWSPFGMIGAGLRQAVKGAKFVAEPLADIIKPVTRAGFTVLSAPLEEIQGLARAGIYGVSTGDWGEAMTHAGGSTFRLAMGDMLEGKRVELGTGFFQGGKLAKEQEDLARRLKINGEWISVGRTVADTIFDPGDTGYKLMSGIVDGALAIGADPTTIALGGLSKVRAAHKLIAPSVTGIEAFAQGARKSGFAGRAVAAAMRPAIENRTKQMIQMNAGMVNGRSKSIIKDQAERFLDNPALDGLYKKWGDQNYGFQQIWEDSGRQMDVRLAKMLGDTKTEAEARALIKRAALDPDVESGVAIHTKKALGADAQVDTGILGRFSDGLARLDAAKKSKVNRAAPRLFRNMPKGVIDIKDFDKHPWKLNQAVEQFDNLQRLLKFDPDQIAINNERLANIKDPSEAYDIVINEVIGNQAKGALVRAGATPDAARQATKLWQNYHRDLMRTFVDEVGENMPIPGIGVGGAALKLPKPTLMSETLNGVIPLPDPRRLRQLTAAPWIQKVTSIPGYQGTLMALDFAMQGIWRPMTLLRGAWTVRVVGEEQFRIEAAGLDSPLFHPLSYIANIVNKGKGDVSFAGDDLRETLAFKESMSKVRNMLDDPGRIATGGKVTFGLDDAEYARGLASELAYMHTDELSRLVAEKGDAWVKGWIRNNPEGDRLRQLYRNALDNPLFDTQAGVERYIDEVISERIRIKTNGHSELKEAIAKGYFRGERLLDVDEQQGVWNGLNKRAVNKFSEVVDDARGGGQFASIIPERVVGEHAISAGRHGELGQKLNNATQFLFNYLMTKQTNRFSRGPAFRQFYWQEGANLIPHLDEAAQRQMLDNLDKAKIPKWLKAEVRDAAKKGTGDLSLKDADTMARASGLQQTQSLLYDISTKGNFADVTRHIFPFAEAWKEVLTRWAHIGFEHPESLRRLQQGVTGARGAGFFQTDPETGEETFIYPGSAAIMNAIGVGPHPLTGEVAGLNIFSQSVLPGFGPIIQASANRLLPNKPEWDEIKSIISPYGDPTEQEGFIAGFAPAWAKRLKHALADPENDRLFGNTVMDMQAYLYSTGEFDTSTIEGRNELQEEAVARARKIFVARAVAPLLGAPASPRARPMAYDKNGDMHVQRLMFDNLRALQENPGTITKVGVEQVEGVGYDNAVAAFMDKYGDEALLFLQPKTYAVVPGAPTTDKGLDWVRENPELVNNFPNVYGYFAPSDGEFDYAAYLRTIKTGEREALDPDQQLALANDKYASMIYYNAKDKLGTNPSAQQEAALRVLKVTLQKKFPGFGTAKAGLPQRAEVPQLISELEDAVENPQLRDTKAGQALTVYLEARRMANEQAQQLGLKGFARGKEAVNIRAAMRTLARTLGQKSPQFALMFDRVLDDEMDEDMEVGGGREEAPAAVGGLALPGS